MKHGPVSNQLETHHSSHLSMRIGSQIGLKVVQTWNLDLFQTNYTHHRSHLAMRRGSQIGLKVVSKCNLDLIQSYYRLPSLVTYLAMRFGYQIGMKVVWTCNLDLFQTNFRLPIAAICKEDLARNWSEISLKHKMFQTCFRPISDR